MKCFRAVIGILFVLALSGAVSAATDEDIILDDLSTPSSPSDSVTLDSLPPIDKMPAVVTFIKADYPVDLVKAGVAGDVVMDLLIDTLGMVDSVALVTSLQPRLDSAAMQALRAFRFSPAMAGGRPVPVIMQYAYHFTLSDVVEKIQEYVNFSGRVVEKGSRAPVADAMVALSLVDTLADTTLGVPFSRYLEKIGSFEGQMLSDGKLVVTTDSMGEFRFKSVPVGPVHIKIPVTGYQAFEEYERVDRDSITTVTYYMDRVSYSEYEAVVYVKSERKEVAKQTLTLNEIRKVPGLGGDAVKVVQALPGVARAPFGGGAIIVRGAGSQDTRYLLDGVELPLLFHFGGLKSVYNSDALANVDLYAGGFGVRYGGAVAGVVELTGRQAKTDRWHGYVDANLFDASFLVEGPVYKNLSALITARRSYIANVIDFALKKVLKQQLFFTAVPFYWDYIGRLDYQPDPKHHLFLTSFGDKDKFDIFFGQSRGSAAADESSGNIGMLIRFDMGIVGWDWSPSKKLINVLRYSPDLFKIEFGVLGNASLSESGTEHSIRDQLTYTWSDQLKLMVGADIRASFDRFELKLIDGNNRPVYDVVNWVFGPYGGYVGAEWRPVKGLLLMPGLRYDYYPQLQSNPGSLLPEFWNYGFDNQKGGSRGEPAVRLAIKEEYLEGQVLKGSLGTYSQSPSGQAIHPRWGYPSLPIQKGSQYVVGHEWQITDLISSDVQCYYNQQWDIARRNEEQASIADGSNPLFLSNGKARMWGMEVLLKHQQNERFFGWIAYSLSRSERWNPPKNRWDLYEKDETHILQLIGSYKMRGNRELGTRVRFVTGDPLTPILGADTVDLVTQRYVPTYGAENSSRMAPFFSVDLRYERKIALRNWYFSAYIDIINLSNLFGYGYVSPEVGGYRYDPFYGDREVISDITRPAIGIRCDF